MVTINDGAVRNDKIDSDTVVEKKIIDKCFVSNVIQSSRRRLWLLT